MTRSGVPEDTELMTPLLPTAAVADALVRHGMDVRMGPTSLRPVIPDAVPAGQALPVRHVGSVDVFLEALERSGDDAIGRILVVDNGGRTDEACIGDLVALECQRAGIAAIVIWGAHRDTSELHRSGLPVFSLGPSPVGPSRNDPRPRDAFDLANLGDLVVTTDDTVFVDDDGLVAVASADLDAVVRTAAEIVVTERAQADQAGSGPTLREQFGFADYLRRRADDPSLTFRRHLRERQASIEE
jgi:regulator of RNase E activity RraA